MECVYKNADSVRNRIASEVRGARSSWSERHLPSSGGAAAAVTDWTAGSSNSRNLGDGAPDRRHDSDDNDGEVSAINPHTLNREFHGPTSSLAFLATVQRYGSKGAGHSSDLGTQALVSTFHNDSFSPQSPPTLGDHEILQTKYYFRQSQNFLNGYFQNIHFIHPIIDRSQFFSRCEDLWFGRHERQSPSFVSLYFAVMSLGALTREWDEDLIDGLGRWDWSRKLFQLASLSMGAHPLSIDLETVQTSIIMAKVCQNELNPHLAYTYLGTAVRTSLSAGHNRQSHSDASADRSIEDNAMSKTWWGLYSVEMEMCFALGRPDSLGADVYHNRALPPITENETAIITPMVDFARIVRKVSAYIYMPATDTDRRIDVATELESELDHWVSSLPEVIRPQLDGSAENLGLKKDPMWAKKQRHTLRLRYYNVMMVLYRPFIFNVDKSATQAADGRDERLNRAVYKCVTSAESTIQLMHHMFATASYFRTWWYNTTYTLYAASIIMGYRARSAGPREGPELLQLINMSIDILRAMDESIVARKAAKLLQQTVDRVQERDSASRARTPHPEDVPGGTSALPPEQDISAPTDFFWDPFGDDAFDFTAQIFPIDGDRLFWENET